ncbi:MAG: hypothetical protein R3290_07980 [Acidimicrobiia bacterium]|nr:hypothetical protein [Acidimicrobiia bacterium]
MEIILFILLAGVWAAFVLPSVMNSRRETPVTQNPRQSSRTAVRQPVGAGGMSERERVLARRRNTLVALGLGAIVTLVAAIVTGSVVLLALSLLVDVALAGYIAMLLQIKQSSGAAGRHGRWESEPEQVRVVSR